MSEQWVKKIEWIIAFVLLLVVSYGSYQMSKRVVEESVETATVDVVLDAGHGSDDPGKIGVNEVLEKDVNLAIVLKMKERLEKEGIGVRLTRESDERVDENGNPYSKAADMKQRVDVMNEMMPKIAVSVHQNSYTSPEIKGAQVFYYSNSATSEKMAEIMQEALRTVDPENTRQIKGSDTYYLLKKTKVPAIIVECGFLSNPEEAEKLASDDYQEKLAEAIVEGIKSCLALEEE